MSTYVVMKPFAHPETGLTTYPSSDKDKPTTVDLSGYDPTKLKVLEKLGVIKTTQTPATQGVE